jgi:Ala-tRNA(Pro) deacylase
MDSAAAYDDTGLFARLDELGIACETHEHPPLYTVEQSRALRGDLPGAHIKNLFLRDKKRCMWLVTVLESRDIDLKALRQRIGAKGTLSFGNADLLMAHLGVIPGAVTPFAVINDRAGSVTMVLDAALQAGTVVNAHPLRNDRTSAIAAEDLVRFLEAEGHPPLILEIDSKDED